MLTPVLWLCVLGLIVSILGMCTTKPVSEWIAPSGPGFWAIPRTLLSVMWFTGGQLICLMATILFAIPLIASF